MATAEQAEALEPQRQETFVEFFISIVETLVVLLFIMTFAFQAFAIPSGSMEKTLLIGDHVFVNRVQFAPRASWLGSLLPYRKLRNDDIAVFVSPEQPGLFLVKRIIGIPGDRIRLHDGVVYRNGVKLDEPYTQYVDPSHDDTYRDDFPSVPPSIMNGVHNGKWREEMPSHIVNGELVVPPGHYFAMGDNRDNSYDSRYFGFVPRENLIGRPMFIYWSFDTPADQYERTSVSERMEAISQTILHFFDKTRWPRTLHLVR